MARFQAKTYGDGASDEPFGKPIGSQACFHARDRKIDGS